MQDSEIQKAAASLLEDIFSNPAPANELINMYTRSRRYIGSKDRRKLTELVWDMVRTKAKWDFTHPDQNWAARILLKGHDNFSNCEFPENVLLEIPDWIYPYFENNTEEMKALLGTAPIVLRANGDREKIRGLLLKEGIETRKTDLSPYGLILEKRVNLAGSNTFQKGLVEVQDEASQMVALETGIKPQDSVLDYCAGAGGKSLIFAQMMNGKGKIVAHDISRGRLKELEKRLTRGGAKNIQINGDLKAEKPASFSHVVVDAPCSGTGTWRRCPDAKWKMTPTHLAHLLKTQEEVLQKAAAYVKPGGKISYMTCSLLSVENKKQVEKFLQKNTEFVIVNEKQFSPAITETDGLYICTMQKR
ncbi:MAG: RsmB/NOP family class I SAM-dependent RNA methyltransferase [Lactobacillales bacterium]|jgi:16S rRNA (cytosine967-C5)-methyltransferase|nr:RsmB/NOP family class I SAM-dependent RNA methyltransferase [Lactobacillales bacterium]